MLDKRRKPSFITGFLLLWILMFPTALLYAADIEFVANGPHEVSLGEQFEISYSVNGNGSSFIGPQITGFSVLSGPNPSTSSNVQIINGQMTQSISTSFSFYLQATQLGTFTIPGASITVNGRRYKSNSLTIKVVKGQTSAARQQQAQSGTTVATLGNKDVFLKASVSKSNPVEGEQVIVSYKIYTRVPIPEYQVTKVPSSVGFWAQDLLDANYRPKQFTERIGGQPYAVAEIKKEALFPQKAGKLIIQPIEVDVVAQMAVKQSKKKHSTDPFGNDPFFDSFFNDVFSGPQVEQVKKSLVSNSLAINVQSLPNAKGESGKPADFTGAVGKFNLSTKVDKTAVKADEPITLNVTISGKGNIKLIDNPKIVFPSDFEVYDPKISDNVSTSSGGIAGTKSFEYILIPRNPGKFTIKPISFTFYDLDQHRYITQTSPAYTFNVSKGEGKMYTSSGSQDLTLRDSDIHFIKQGDPKLKMAGEYFYKSPLFWIWLILPALLFATLLILMKNELKKRRDAALMKNRRATRMARKRMSKAKSFLVDKNSDLFYEEVSQALWNYLSDKFYIQRAELSMETVRETLLQKNVSESVVDELIKMLEHCEFARFAQAGKASDLQQVYDSAVTLITTIENKPK
ncbi:MAG: BatD family protein [Bacteroidota bacterium]|nr:BatD family protein [Bacteroidota bacterium]